jgi:hypothetical protein
MERDELFRPCSRKMIKKGTKHARKTPDKLFLNILKDDLFHNATFPKLFWLGNRLFIDYLPLFQILVVKESFPHGKIVSLRAWCVFKLCARTIV